MCPEPLQDRLFADFPTFQTTRLSLRAMSLEDAEDLRRLCSDERVAEFQDWGPLERLAEATQFITERMELFRRRVRISWGVALEPNGPLIGQIGMHSISLRDRRAEIAFDLRSDFWRQGLMSEALSAVLAFAFDRCELNKVVAQTVVQNRACHRLLLKLGFGIEGRLPAHYFWKGVFHDVHLYGLRRANVR